MSQLKTVIKGRHDLIVLALLYRGVSLDDDRQLAHLMPSISKIINSPRFSMRTRSIDSTDTGTNNVCLSVTNPEDSTFQVHLPAQSTIADLKNLIQDTEGYTSNQEFVLISHDTGRRVYEHRYLATYNLKSGSYVHVAWMMVGGGGPIQNFVDMENNSSLKTQKIGTATRDTPVWKIVGNGLNIRGVCRNVKCEAHGRNAWCQKGYTVFNILLEHVECPSCRKRVSATTCGFLGCEWMFEGRKRGVSSDVVSEWTVTTGQDFQWFDDCGGRNTVHWSSLVITARRLASARRVGRECMEYVSETDCVLCFGPVDTKDNIVTRCGHVGTRSCGHVVHPECVREFVRAGYDTCPTCRLPLGQGGSKKRKSSERSVNSIIGNGHSESVTSCWDTGSTKNA